MKKFNIALEKGKRYFENNEIKEYCFIALEFIFNKDEIKSGTYSIKINSEIKILFEQFFKIDVLNKNIIFENYHEDPLIESDTHYFICAPLTEENLLFLLKENKFECNFYYENKFLRKEIINSNTINLILKEKEWHSKIVNYNASSDKKSIIRMHLGKNDLNYHEEEFILNSNEIYNFKHFLNDYEYVAIQFAYEVPFDIEEKHVLKGLKGIINSSYYLENENLIYPLFPFDKKYTKVSNANWIKIETINGLIDFYQKNPNKLKLTFEMNESFIVDYYKKYQTSSFGELYSIKKPKLHHVDSNLCKGCQFKSKCMQLVPSGLSEDLFKKNLLVESFENCVMYRIINKLKD